MQQDRKRPEIEKIEIGNIYHSKNYGDFIIIMESQARRKRMKCYDIKFLTTNSIRHDIVRTEILKGEVKDYYLPKIAGVGYLGEGIQQKDYKYEYSIWKHMLHRCYNKKDCNYKFYGEKGVMVCDRWCCFKTFVEDIPYIEGYDAELFKAKLLDLDKDMKSNIEKKIYSLSTCTFITHLENLKVMNKQKKRNCIV